MLNLSYKLYKNFIVNFFKNKLICLPIIEKSAIINLIEIKVGKMLKLKNIKKVYELGKKKDKNYQQVESLKGINIEFRKSEFVSVLGPSGCGKTTLLNIVGGLDKYTSGDLVINNKSTKEFKDSDWDNYRNHSVGFVFQSYNLIPHQTVLQNVELALTLSGVSKAERKSRATEVLKKVGLKDKLDVKPNQLSGGQMQRVAIARALVNDPEIILADEPTGALDSKTSIQIMNLLKEISNDKLIIMVTHNPELAEQYSTRIVKLLDGKVIDDSNPYTADDEEKQSEKLLGIADDSELNKKQQAKKNKKKRMSFFTALSLSFKNLLTKKARTILVSFAGSIGIIGIALVLAISSGFSTYVNQIQRDTLSSYPVQLTNSNYDMASLMQIFVNSNGGSTEHGDDKVYTKQELTDMLSKFNASSSSSDLASFKKYIENEGKEELEKYASAIQYVYGANINAYYNSSQNGLICANPTTVFSDIIAAYPASHPDIMTSPDKQLRYSLLNYMFGSSSSYYKNEFWSEMLDNQELLQSQYELVGEGSKWATEYNEIMIVIDENNEISDYTLYGLGLLNQEDLNTLLDNYINNEDPKPITTTFEYADLLNLEYKLILESDYFEYQNDGTYLDIRTLKTTKPELYNEKIQNLYDTKGITIKVAGIIREKADASATTIDTCIAYNSSLTEYIVALNNQREIVQAQINNDTTNIITNQPFTLESTKEKALSQLGYVDMTTPQGIYIYPKDFEAKNSISNFISNYNAKCVSVGEESKVVTYSDTIGTMMNSISTIISSITYILIAFVSVSLIVSSIMIGIITYISVIERTKEIGVLRSVGASKRDVKRVFTAESLIIGLTAGVLGIVITLILTIPINIIIQSLAGISGVAKLPALGAVILIAISMFLTFIAGLFPAKVASKKDPVIALRTE